MGYERDDRRYGRDPSHGRDQDYGRNSGINRNRYGAGAERSRFGDDPRDNPYGRDRDYGRQPQGYDYDDRGFFDRAGDEVRSWFGDEEAERRRRFDEQNAEREYRRNYGSGDRQGGRDGYREHDRSYADPAVYAGAGGGFTSRGSGSGGFGTGSSGLGSGDGAGDYGSGFGAGATGTYGLGSGGDRAAWGSDHTYRSWRDRQLETFDRDYADYQREHQSKFDNDFHSWRQSRQTQRDTLTRVQEHQEVVGSDGQHVGTVDKVRGDRIVLTKNDQDASGHHHSIPCSWIQSVEDRVTISKTAEEAKSHWKDEERKSAFGSDNRNDQSSGARNLNRSFSGTY
ncbi:MAG: DUF2171 domain-containing protein [Alphaproteobacteria bacterium]|nr:MAG: DUF2171 domain-containing protein [Alphaproteobacteria bacterium]